METATAPAQEVFITDQLDITNLDLSTFSFGPISFGETIITPFPGLSEFYKIVDLRPDNDLLVKIEARLNQDTGLLSWTFTSLDPVTGRLPEDPSAGFLPPNANPPGGDGSVLFTVMPKSDLSTNTEIRNQASIIFDTNDPILTDAWLNTIDNTSPVSQVFSLSDTQFLTEFNVKWSGTDDGAGIRDYTIFVSENEGPFVEWLVNTTQTSWKYSGTRKSTYAFYSVARDLTGNVEAKESQSEATTKVCFISSLGY
jgi:hypothetical protein